MTTQVTATEAKAHLLALLDRVADGEEVEITKYGRTVARLVPANSPRGLRGIFQGTAISAADDEALFSTGLTWNVQA